MHVTRGGILSDYSFYLSKYCRHGIPSICFYATLPKWIPCALSGFHKRSTHSLFRSKQGYCIDPRLPLTVGNRLTNDHRFIFTKIGKMKKINKFKRSVSIDHRLFFLLKYFNSSGCVIYMGAMTLWCVMKIFFSRRVIESKIFSADIAQKRIIAISNEEKARCFMQKQYDCVSQSCSISN